MIRKNITSTNTIISIFSRKSRRTQRAIRTDYLRVQLRARRTFSFAGRKLQTTCVQQNDNDIATPRTHANNQFAHVVKCCDHAHTQSKCDALRGCMNSIFSQGGTAAPGASVVILLISSSFTFGSVRADHLSRRNDLFFLDWRCARIAHLWLHHYAPDADGPHGARDIKTVSRLPVSRSPTNSSSA